MQEDKKFNVDKLLQDLFKEPTIPKQSYSENLRDLFQSKIDELNITFTDASNILKIQYRTLNGILDGSQKTVDFSNFPKIANFIQLPVENVIYLYVKELEKKYIADSEISPEKIKFIKDNFDLAVLRTAKIIDSITNFQQIESKLNEILDLSDITEYKKPEINVAFSAGLLKPKNELTRALWIERSKLYFEKLNNPYDYNREGLIKYFPEIRWHSTNVEHGLLEVIKSLFKLGITVIYQPPLPSLHLKGATFVVNDKPCIVLTNYRGYYPTMWFSLVHELYHVLFDIDEIKSNIYHLSEEDNNQLSVVEKENEANAFAREYLFSKAKTEHIKPHINNEKIVSDFAKDNHIHPSFIYVFNAFDKGGKAWGLAKTKNVEFDSLLAPLNNSWENPIKISQHVNSIKKYYY